MIRYHKIQKPINISFVKISACLLPAIRTLIQPLFSCTANVAPAWNLSIWSSEGRCQAQRSFKTLSFVLRIKNSRWTNLSSFSYIFRGLVQKSTSRYILIYTPYAPSLDSEKKIYGQCFYIYSEKGGRKTRRAHIHSGTHDWNCCAARSGGWGDEELVVSSDHLQSAKHWSSGKAGRVDDTETHSTVLG